MVVDIVQPSDPKAPHQYQSILHISDIEGVLGFPKPPRWGAVRRIGGSATLSTWPRCRHVCEIALGSHDSYNPQRFLPISAHSAPPAKPSPPPHNLQVGDFFCGAGGFSEGARQVGFKVALGVDNDHYAVTTWKVLKTYLEPCTSIEWLCVAQANHPAGDVHHADVEAYLEELKKGTIKLPVGGVDVVLIAPPCRRFSAADPDGQDDSENQVLFQYVVDVALATDATGFVWRLSRGMYLVEFGIILPTYLCTS